MNSDLLYQISLTQINGIGVVQAKQLLEFFGSAEAIFKAKKKDLSSVEGIGEIKASCIKKFDDFKIAENEILFLEKHHIQALFLSDEDYPKRLLHCYDAPTLLYYRGNANLNHHKIISIIGTRNNSSYGKEVTEKIVSDLKELNVLIISGLAFGIDAIAHKSALQNNMSTIGVLAHSLDTIYPAQHKSMAKEMLQSGGLISEFIQNTKPDKHNFPKRNRIVAGMADATIVIETATKGGSMITAELAYNYNRDLFAVPGKITDAKSSGCLKLIQQNKANIFTSTQDIIESLGWQQNTKQPQKQREIFIELEPNEKIIFKLIEQKSNIHIDEIFLKSGLNSSTVAACILNLELNNLINCLPGKTYSII